MIHIFLFGTLFLYHKLHEEHWRYFGRCYRDTIIFLSFVKNYFIDVNIYTCWLVQFVKRKLHTSWSWIRTNKYTIIYNSTTFGCAGDWLESFIAFWLHYHAFHEKGSLYISRYVMKLIQVPRLLFTVTSMTVEHHPPHIFLATLSV